MKQKRKKCIFWQTNDENKNSFLSSIAYVNLKIAQSFFKKFYPLTHLFVTTIGSQVSN